MQARELLIALSIKYGGKFDKIYKAIQTKETITDEEIQKLMSTQKSKAITILDDNYPDCLKIIKNPSLVLFYKGDISLLDANKKGRLAIIGARECTEYGVEATKKLITEMDHDYIIVSGLARGIDSVAHSESIKNGMKNIGVIANGIDICYPKQSAALYTEIVSNKGLLITEYPDGAKPEPDNFIARNRIIAGIANAVLVADAREQQSGTISTVEAALAFGKDVLAVPYPINISNSCNSLIQDGATLVTSGKDINAAMKSG